MCTGTGGTSGRTGECDSSAVVILVATPQDRRARCALWAVSLALFAGQLEFFALQLAMPHIASDFHVSATSLHWIISGYVLVSGSLMIAAGRLGDIFGRRRMMLAGLGLFASASLLCAAADSVPWLVACRLVQGAGDALVTPAGFALLTNAFSTERRGRATGFALGVGAVGSAAGPFIGGTLTQEVGWRWIFLINVPLALAAAIAAGRAGESRDEKAPRSVDWPGLVTVTGAVAAVASAVDQSQDAGWASASSLALLGAGIVLLAAFAAVESRVRYPLIQLSLLRKECYVAITASGAVANAASLLCVFIPAIYLQQVRGLSPAGAGVILLAPVVMKIVSGPVAGRLSRRRPLTIMAVATALAGAAMLALAFVTTVPSYIAVLSVSSGALGLACRYTIISAQAVVPACRAGEASGVTLTVMTIAGGMAVALAGSALAGHGTPDATGLNVIMAVGAAGCLVTSGFLVLRARLMSAPCHTSAD
ncbi:MFS transporter [Streptomyces osmaniensis]|uniref:MFS transporter n=1 Tax=Streptomyces osmaniensis TaxID=593134 RepID=A0ABP6Z3V4_9ACTN